MVASAGFEVVVAFLRLEHSDNLADGVPQRLDGSLGFGAQHRLQFGERLLDGVDVRAVGWEIKRPASRAFDCVPSALCAGRLCMTTISPGTKVVMRACCT